MAVEIIIRNDLFGRFQKLIVPLSPLLIVRLLYEHACVIASIDFVLDKVSVILSGHCAISLLHGFIHQLVLIHVVTEGFVAT